MTDLTSTDCLSAELLHLYCDDIIMSAGDGSGRGGRRKEGGGREEEEEGEGEMKGKRRG